MSLQVEELQVLISANADQFKAELMNINSQLARLSGTTAKTSDKIGGSLTSSIIKGNIATQVMIGTVKKVAQGFWSLTKAVAYNGSEYSRLKIATETVTRNMGMTTEEVDNLRESLIQANTYGTRAEEVIKTLAMSGLVDMANSLETVDARTGQTVKGISALVLTMKDLSATAGLDSAEGINRLTRFVRRGELAFADGIIEMGNINLAYREYGKSVNKSIQDLSEQERATVRLNIIMEEGRKSWGAYANVMQTSAKAWDSTGNVVRTLAELLGNFLEPILSALGNTFFQLSSGIRYSLMESEGSVRSWANKVTAYIVAVVRIIGSLLTKIPIIGKNFQSLKDFALKPVKTAMDSLTDSAGGTSEAIGNTTKSAKELKKEMLGLAGFDEMNILKEQDDGSTGAGSTGVGIGGVNLKDMINSDDLNASVEDINAMATEIERNLRSKLKSLGDALKPIWDFLKPIAVWFKDNIVTILAVAGAIAVLTKIIKTVVSVATTLKTIWVAVSGIITGLVTFFSAGGTFDGISLAIMYAFEGIKAGMIAIAGALGISVGWLIVIIGVVITAIVLLVKNWDWVKEKAIMVWNWLSDNVFKPVGEFFTKVFDGMVNTVKGWFESINSFFSRIKTEIIDPIKNEFEKFFNGFVIPIIHNFILVMKLAWEGLKLAVEIAWNYIKENVIKPVVDWINTYIAPIIRAVVNTIVSAFNTLKGALQTVWNFIRNNIIQPFLDWFGSKIMPIINMVAQGFKTAFEGVSNFIGGIWEGIKNIFKGGINWIIDRVNWFINKANDMIRSYNNTVGVLPDAMKISYRFSTIPKLATGGVIDSPTYALLGEAGKEAVMPLENNTQWIDLLASKLNAQSGGGQTLIVKLGEDKIYDKFIEFINDKSMASNTNLITI